MSFSRLLLLILLQPRETITRDKRGYGIFYHSPFLLFRSLFHCLQRIRPSTFDLHGKMQMGLESNLRGDFAHSADRLSHLYLIALFNADFFVKAAIDGCDIVVMEDFHGQAHQGIILYRSHSAVTDSLYRRTLVRLDVDAVMGAPLLQGDVFHQLTIAVGSEDFTGDRQDEGGVLRLWLRLDLCGRLGRLGRSGLRLGRGG